MKNFVSSISLNDVSLHVHYLWSWGIEDALKQNQSE